MASGYDSLRRLTYESLLPVLERCGVILSRLLGLSKYHRISPILGLETKDLKDCQATVDCLNLLAHKVLISTSTELREFGAFSKWLRYQIDLQATDPLSTAAEELLEKADAVDHGMTLSYIQGAMMHSALQDFIQAPPSETYGDRWVDPGENSLFYENYKKLLQQHNQRKSDEERVVLPQLSDLTSRLTRQCDAVFKRIAETQRRGILHRTALTLGPDCDAGILDMVMDYSVSNAVFVRRITLTSLLPRITRTRHWLRYILRPDREGHHISVSTVITPTLCAMLLILSLQFISIEVYSPR